jgi:AcrR family transcriptional regulator
MDQNELESQLKGVGRKRNPEESRRRILDAGERAFALRGFGGARLRDIAHEASVHHALVHHYYGDKRGLLQEVIRRGLERMAIACGAALEGASSFEETGRAFVGALFDFCAENRGLLRIIDDAFRNSELVSFDITQEALSALAGPVFAGVRDAIEAGQRAGVPLRHRREHPDRARLAGGQRARHARRARVRDPVRALGDAPAALARRARAASACGGGHRTASARGAAEREGRPAWARAARSDRDLTGAQQVRELLALLGAQHAVRVGERFEDRVAQALGAVHAQVQRFGQLAAIEVGARQRVGDRADRLALVDGRLRALRLELVDDARQALDLVVVQLELVRHDAQRTPHAEHRSAARAVAVGSAGLVTAVVVRRVMRVVRPFARAPPMMKESWLHGLSPSPGRCAPGGLYGAGTRLAPSNSLAPAHVKSIALQTT